MNADKRVDHRGPYAPGEPERGTWRWWKWREAQLQEANQRLRDEVMRLYQEEAALIEELRNIRHDFIDDSEVVSPEPYPFPLPKDSQFDVLLVWVAILAGLICFWLFFGNAIIGIITGGH